jgi:hypothetical protein
MLEGPQNSLVPASWLPSFQASQLLSMSQLPDTRNLTPDNNFLILAICYTTLMSITTTPPFAIKKPSTPLSGIRCIFERVLILGCSFQDYRI